MGDSIQPVVGQSIKVKKAVKLYSIAFALLKNHSKFSYRSVNAVKIGPHEAILIPSGKIVKLAADKMVKVRP